MDPAVSLGFAGDASVVCLGAPGRWTVVRALTAAVGGWWIMEPGNTGSFSVLLDELKRDQNLSGRGSAACRFSFSNLSSWATYLTVERKGSCIC